MEVDDTIAMEASSSDGAFGSSTMDILTPRSKVAKMLADIDEEIDNAPTPSPTNRHSQKVARSPTGSHADTMSPATTASGPDRNLLKPTATADNELAESSSDSDESEDGVRRPQGRAARRMLGEEENSTDVTASLGPVSTQSRAVESATEDDEDDLYSATPRKPYNRTRIGSSSPAGHERGNGLFISPAKTVNSEGEEELPSNPFGNNDKLAQLIAKKRAERLAKESEEKRRKKNSPAANTSSDLPDEAFENSQDPTDPNIEKIMSDATRPTRKAGKKAMLELERETQRLAREQALAHQMKVKKKFTTNDLFAKFNFRQPSTVGKVSSEQQHQHQHQHQQLEGDSSASSVPNSDGIEEKTKDSATTPPSSPPTPLDKQRELVEAGALNKLIPVREDSLVSLAELDDDEELPDLADILKASQKTKVTSIDDKQEDRPAKKGFKLARLGKKAVAHPDSSDDELDIVPSLPPHLRAFEKISNTKRTGRPADSRAIHNLRHLAHMHADDTPQHKKGSKPSISAKALENQLRRQAKEQARQQQLERIEELRAKGIEVQTTEEREKEAEVLENLLEKARQDAVELRKAEKAARVARGGEEAMQASDDEDEDYSDSEDDDGDDDGDEDEDDGREASGDGLLDEAAEEDSGSEEESEDDDGVQEFGDKIEHLEEEAGKGDTIVAPPADIEVGETRFSTPAVTTRKPRTSRIIMDDEDDADSEPEDEAEQAEAEDDPFAAFNFGAAGNANALLSPTQAFHATMETPTQATQDDSFDMLRHLAPSSAFSMAPSVPDIDTQFDDEEESTVGFVAGSQVPESQRLSLNWETQPPETPVPANLYRNISALSETPGWEPTQDPGLPSPWSVKLRREDTLDSLEEHETQSTVRMRVSESPVASQTAPRRGKLVRRQAVVEDDSDEDELVGNVASQPKKKDAFSELARRRKEALTAAEKAEAEKEMREMMDEQAEESEDEYAGLGGDDFVAPETEQDKEMIDSSYIDVDERELAAHYAERERIRNEAETSRLYKDLTTGVLRRKMGANAFDLEEDEDELAARRRQMRQQEEARKRKALLKDINIATLADGKRSKGKDAFLKAIADDDDGDEDPANISGGESESVAATQEDIPVSQSQEPVDGSLKETSGNKRRMPTDEGESEVRPPAKQRRTQASELRRPTSLLEVKESVSFLLEEPNATATLAQTMFELSSDPENEEKGNEQWDDDSEADDFIAAEEARDNNGGFAPNPKSMDAKAMPPPRLPASQRRTVAKPAVVDRLSLKRVSSASDSAHGRTAWAAGPATGGFKVPSLLRRATTNIAPSGANERGVTTPSVSREHSGGVKMGGTKKSSLAYQARAEERRAIVEASAKRREENTARIALLRRNSSALNRGLTGRFE